MGRADASRAAIAGLRSDQTDTDLAVTPTIADVDVRVRAEPLRIRLRAAARADPAMARVFVFALIVGIGIRVFLLLSPFGDLDSDEAVVGLMAQDMLQGDYRAFFWGQTYGGTAETWLIAQVFAVFGASVTTLRLTMLALNAAIVVLIWRVAQQMLPRRNAAYVAIMAIIWPPFTLWWYMKSPGFYNITLIFGLASLLLALRTAAAPRWFHGLFLGVLVGLGFWNSPLSIVFTVPAVAYFVIRRPRSILLAPFLVSGFAIGVLPWLANNLANGWQSLAAGQGFDLWSTYRERAWSFVTTAFPTLLGLKMPGTCWFARQCDFDAGWTMSRLSPILYVIVLAGLLASLVYTIAGRKWKFLLMLAPIIAYPFLYAMRNDFTWWVGHPRYLLPLAPLLTILLGLACSRTPVAAGLIVALAVVSVVTFVSWDPVADPNTHHVEGREELIEHLDSLGVTAAYSDSYWLGYSISFLSGRRIEMVAIANSRSASSDERVENASKVAFVVQTGSDWSKWARSKLNGRLELSSVTEIPGYTVYVVEPALYAGVSCRTVRLPNCVYP